jgi:hypothetical protein
MPEKNQDALLKLAAERFKNISTIEKDERLAKDYDLRFAINEDNCQWSKEIKDFREKSDPPRPCISINKIPEKLDVVQGEFEQLEPSHKVRPIDSAGDPIVAEIIGGLIQRIERTSLSRAAYNHSHYHNIICGKGCWRHDIVEDPDDPFVRSIEVNSIPNPMSVYFGPCKKPDKSDASYVFVMDWITKEEYKKEYGEEFGEWPEDQYWTDWKHQELGYRIAEYWYKEMVDRKFYQIERSLRPGLPYKMTVTEDKLQETDAILKELTVKRPQIRWCKMRAGKVLEGPYDWPARNIPIFEEAGITTNIRGFNRSRGKVRNAIVPQQLYNYWTTANTEFIALTPKNPLFATPAMFQKHKHIWDQMHVKNFSYVPYDPDPEAPQGKPFREPPPQLSTALVSEMQRMDHDIMAAMGIYTASLGDKRGEESGRSLIAQQKQGNVGSQTFVGNFTTTYIYSIKSLVDLIPYVYDSERILRIVGKDGKEISVPINAMPGTPLLEQVPEIPQNYLSNPRIGVTIFLNDLTVGRYDVDVSVGPSFTTQRQEMVEQLMRVTEIVARAAPQMALPIAYAIMENLDLPNSQKLLDQIKKVIPVEIRGLDEGEEPPQPQGPPPELMLKMEEMQLKAHEQQRKDFEAFTNAVAKLMTAESQELGQQVQAFTAVAQQMLAAMQPQPTGSEVQ